MFAEYNHKYISVPLFAIQSPYDTWCLPYILGLFCAKGGSLSECQNTGVMNIVEEYHQNASKVLREIAKNPNNGFWAPSCANHCYSFTGAFYDEFYRIPANSVNSLSKSIGDWIEKKPGNHAFEDSVNWPGNLPCSGLNKKNPNFLLSQS